MSGQAVQSVLESIVTNTNGNEIPIATAVFFGYLANILVSSRPIIRPKLEDYPGCGQRLADFSDWFSYFSTPPDECTWDCDWTDAPFLDPSFNSHSRQILCSSNGLSPIELENCVVNNETRAFSYYNSVVKAHFVYNLLKIPKNMECLSDCSGILSSFWESSCHSDAWYYNETLNEDLTQENDPDAFYNCYMDKRKLSETELDFKPPADGKDLVVTRDFMDVIFEVCYLAKTFKEKINALIITDPTFANFKFCEDPGLLGPYNNPKCSLIPNAECYLHPFSKKKKNNKNKRKHKKKNKAKGKRNGKGNRAPKQSTLKNKKQNPYTDKRSNFMFPKDRLNGPLGFINFFSQQYTSGYPWQCSLRYDGYRGVHRCGVTLLSGPPKTTILVGAAHCNYVCRNEMGKVLEMCCCGNNQLSSCTSKGSYCSGRPMLQEARNTDLKIVCGEHNIGQIPEHISFENEIVLDIEKIIIHEDFKPGKPLDGNDIAVYIINEHHARTKMNIMKTPFEAMFDEILAYYCVGSDGLINESDCSYDFLDFPRRFRRSLGKMILPACLPKNQYSLNDKAIFSSWVDPKPGYLTLADDIKTLGGFTVTDNDDASNSTDKPDLEDITSFFNKYGAQQSIFGVWPQHARMVKEECKDPAWMRRSNSGAAPSNTLYPAGTTCYKEPSSQSCMLFGSSGSGLVKHFNEKNISVKDVNVLNGAFTLEEVELLNFDDSAPDGAYGKYGQYGFVGPLSMFKGCDRASNINYEDLLAQDTDKPNINSVNFTDGTATLEPNKWLMIYGADNVAVYTDAYCFLDWIAKQYDMDPPDGWVKPDHCFKSTGDPSDFDQTVCNTLQGSTCDFSGKATLDVRVGAYDATIKMDKCQLLDVGGGYADNINMCVNKEGNLDHCANNCRGVDPNAVVAGGVGAVLVANLAATNLLAPAAGVATLGLGGAATVGVGGAVMMMMDQRRRRRRCPRSRPCKDRTTGRCCRGISRPGRRNVCRGRC